MIIIINSNNNIHRHLLKKNAYYYLYYYTEFWVNVEDVAATTMETSAVLIIIDFTIDTFPCKAKLAFSGLFDYLWKNPIRARP